MGLLRQFRKGSTPVLILSVLRSEPKYGYQIMRELEQKSDGYFTMTAALLYPALRSLEEDGLIRSEWREGENGRRRKYYEITPQGQTVFTEHTQEWEFFLQKLLAVTHSA